MTRADGMVYIKNQFLKLEIELSEEQCEQFYTYYEMLIEKNKVMNLTAIIEFDEVVQKHFLDSALLSSSYIRQDGSNQKLIDVGTGAGFPGMPLKILYPDLQVTLLDSLNKRIQFLEEVITALKLKKINTVHYRAEDGARDPRLREQYDFAVSRAVANMATLSEYCIPYVKRSGFFIAYKSENIENELEQAKKAIFLLGGKEIEVKMASLPDSSIKRSIVFIKKNEKTAKKYPRKAGTPAKQPLL